MHEVCQLDGYHMSNPKKVYSYMFINKNNKQNMHVHNNKIEIKTLNVVKYNVRVCFKETSNKSRTVKLTECKMQKKNNT